MEAKTKSKSQLRRERRKRAKERGVEIKFHTNMGDAARVAERLAERLGFNAIARPILGKERKRAVGVDMGVGHDFSIFGVNPGIDSSDSIEVDRLRIPRNKAIDSMEKAIEIIEREMACKPKYMASQIAPVVDQKALAAALQRIEHLRQDLGLHQQIRAAQAQQIKDLRVMIETILSLPVGWGIKSLADYWCVHKELGQSVANYPVLQDALRIAKPEIQKERQKHGLE